MLEEYKRRVILAYQKKKAENTLSGNLITPSPGKLRDECRIVYHERYQPKDDEILRLFFTSKNNDGDYTKSIENFNIDKFRPLVNLLNDNKEIKRSRDRNISLLSWLINFEPRPYRLGQVYENEIEVKKTEDGKSQVKEIERKDEEIKTDKPDQEKDNSLNTKERSNGRIISLLSRPIVRSAAFATVLLLFISGAYLVKENIAKQCMYWADDHYEPIACDQKVAATVIAFNEEKVKNLRKITRPDTLTLNAIGKVWYAKIKVDSAEFYTDSGEYPLDTRKRLLPITPYMLNKYVFAKRISTPL